MDAQKLLESIIQLSKGKVNLLQGILILSKNQILAMNESQLEKIDECLNKKDQLIQTINNLDDEFKQHVDLLKAELHITSLEELTRYPLNGCSELKELVVSITNLIEKIIEVENESKIAALQYKNHISDKLKQVNVGRKATTAYYVKPTQAPSYFIDRKK